MSKDYRGRKDANIQQAHMYKERTKVGLLI